MYYPETYSIPEVANDLELSEDLIKKFIKKGLIIPVNDGLSPKLTRYNIRRLLKIVDLYEKSFSTDSIEYIINH
jgi:predicted DNA-binding protein YlxM (UPF0122 family)